jgi:hypothetical protein
MGEDEEGTLAALRGVRRELADPKIAEHRGRIVKTTGDGLLAEFASIVDAVRYAVEVQPEMIVRNAATPAQRRIEFRMGIRPAFARTLTFFHRKFANSTSPACASPACRSSEPPCSRDPEGRLRNRSVGWRLYALVSSR